MTFTPKEIKSFDFDLPISLKGYSESIGLERTIKCEALEKPTIVFKPSIIKFNDIIISQVSNEAVEQNKSISVKNEGFNKIFWEIDKKY